MEFNATFLISAISFIVFTFLMNVILYKPLEKIVNEREELINGNYSDADKNKEKAKSLLESVAEKLAKSKSDAKSVYNTEKQKAEDEVSKILADAKAKNNDFISESKNKLQEEAQKIEEQTEILATAQMISDKLLRENIPIGGN